MPEKTVPTRRIIELDLLRGFFIVVIILDHAQYWPSPLQYITGEGRLWVSAAEGFFIISGFLIGYLRAYKGKHTPLKVLTKKLLERAGLLWFWCVLITLIVTALTVLLPGDGSHLPKLPDPSQTSSLLVYLWNIVTMQYASDWIYFLRLYAIMLALTPIFLWLLRKKHSLTAIALILGTYLVSLAFGINEGAMQWQVLFFGAALFGWKFEEITAWFRARPRLRTATLVSLITIGLSSMVLSYFMVHGWDYVESPATSISRETYISIRANVDPLFSNNPLVFPRIALSFIWFGGLLALFHVFKPHLQRWLGWLLLPFGNASLSAYCLQAVVLCFVVTFIPVSENFWVNGAIGVGVLLLILGLMKVPVIKKILPV